MLVILLVSWFVLSKTDTISIKVARSHVDVSNTTRYTVKGQLTSTPGQFKDLYSSQNGYCFTIQDETGGMHVYIEEESFYNGDTSKFVIGREVTVTGIVDSNTGPLDKQEGGTVRINPTDLNDIVIGDIISKSKQITPRFIDPDQVKDYQGELVVVRDVNVSHLIVASKYGTDWRVVDSEGKATSIWVYYQWSDNGNKNLVIGQEYEYIKGIAGVFVKFEASHEFEEFWEIWPRTDDDWSEKTSNSATINYVIGIIGCVVFVVLYQ
eukprot:98442_1